MTDSQFPKTEQNKVRRVPKNASYDRETVFNVIDSAWVGHIAIVDASTEQATVIPMLHARDGDELIFHGANSSRLMKYLSSGKSVCVSFTRVDGLVLAKSLFHHSMNYRSAVVFGTGYLVESTADAIASLRVLSDKIMPGRWDDARQPNDKELSATAVVRLKIESASAKIRTGEPNDEPEDISLPVWSGVLPFVEVANAPISDSNSQSLAVPDYLTAFRKQRNEQA